MYCELTPVPNIPNRPQCHRRRRRWARSCRTTAFYHRDTNQPITVELCSRGTLLSLRRGHEHTEKRLRHQLQLEFKTWPTPSLQRVKVKFWLGWRSRNLHNKTRRVLREVLMVLRKLSLAKQALSQWTCCIQQNLHLINLYLSFQKRGSLPENFGKSPHGEPVNSEYESSIT